MESLLFSFRPRAKKNSPSCVVENLSSGATFEEFRQSQGNAYEIIASNLYYAPRCHLSGAMPDAAKGTSYFPHCAAKIRFGRDSRTHRVEPYRLIACFSISFGRNIRNAPSSSTQPNDRNASAVAKENILSRQHATCRLLVFDKRTQVLRPRCFQLCRGLSAFLTRALRGARVSAATSCRKCLFA